MIVTIISNLIIGPLIKLFEIVFSIAYAVFGNPLIVLIIMSVVVNLFALPLYRRADAIQDEENKKQSEMKPWLDHIKKTFKGDERYMMTTAYYRLKNYKTLSALRGSISLLLQVPFFIAAYQFLSNLAVLKTMSFWVFKNLGEPDHLLTIGNMSLNVLPIIMTLINVISAVIYLRDCTASQKIQTYLLAAVFLVLLYNSPSGLVFYWTCNQVFSLIKNIFLKAVKSKIVLGIVVSIIGVVVFLATLLTGKLDTPQKIFLLILVLCCCQIPLIIALIKKKVNKKSKPAVPIGNKMYFLSVIFMTIFVGIVIPLTVISSSATEFVSTGNTPLAIILNNVSLVAGVFLVWESVFYFLAKTKVRNAFIYVTFALCGVSILDFFAFGQGMGFVSEFLVYDKQPVFSLSTKIINLLLVIAVSIVLCFLLYKFKKIMLYVCVVMIVGAIGLAITNISTTINELNSAETEEIKFASEADEEYELSRNGKNIVLIMLDRAAGVYIPYVFNEKPELMEQFAGFTFYKNTLGYGAVTFQAIPAMYGGYDYTPYELNKRSDEKLNAKHTEAMMVLPTILSENNFNVFVADPIYVGNYRGGSHSDLSLYDSLKNTTAVNLAGKYTIENTEILGKYFAEKQNRSMFFYSIMKILPVWGQNTLYEKGEYLNTDTRLVTTDAFLKAYAELEALPYMTGINDTSENNYIVLENMTAHSPTVLDPETYLPTVIEAKDMFGDKSRFTLDGVKIKMRSENEVGHYNAIMASMIAIGNWLDYLREQGVYDNTRIILVADHGNYSRQLDSLNPTDNLNIQTHLPLLMVKDFNSKEWTVSEEYMTNADVPALVLNGVVDNPVNPSTGNSISLDDERKYNEQIVVLSASWNRDEVYRSTQIKCDDLPWAVFKPSNVWDASNWTEVPYESIDFTQ